MINTVTWFNFYWDLRGNFVAAQPAGNSGLASSPPGQLPSGCCYCNMEAAKLPPSWSLKKQQSSKNYKKPCRNVIDTVFSEMEWTLDKISLWSTPDQHLPFHSLCSGGLWHCKETGWEFASLALTRSLAKNGAQNFFALHTVAGTSTCHHSRVL